MITWVNKISIQCLSTPLNEAEVIRIIKLCKPKDSMAYDDISMWVLSKIAPQVVKPLVHIFNLSFSTGIFPCEMKMAKVIPLFKNGNKSDFSNYRLISPLPQFSKILEKLFNERLQRLLNTNNTLSNSQYGLNLGHTCSAGLAYMAEVAHATGPALLGPRTHGNIIFCARFNNRPKQRAYNAE